MNDLDVMMCLSVIFPSLLVMALSENVKATYVEPGGYDEAMGPIHI